MEVVRGRMPGTTSGCNNFVDARDVAHGMVLAWQRGKAGERYILGGENLPYRDFVERTARIAGTRPPGREIPHWLARLVGRVGDLGERLTDREPIINSVTVGFSYSTAFQFSSDKAKRELGYDPDPHRARHRRYHCVVSGQWHPVSASARMR